MKGTQMIRSHRLGTVSAALVLALALGACSVSTGSKPVGPGFDRPVRSANGGAETNSEGNTGSSVGND